MCCNQMQITREEKRITHNRTRAILAMIGHKERNLMMITLLRISNVF